MATVSEHLEKFAALVKQGVDPDLGCGAFLQVLPKDDYESSPWTTGLVQPEDSVLDTARDTTWEYKDGALQGDLADAQKMLERVLPNSEVHLLIKQSGSTSNPARVFIGRGKQNDVTIRHETVSSIHLQVEMMDDDRVVAIRLPLIQRDLLERPDSRAEQAGNPAQRRLRADGPVHLLLPRAK